MTDTQTHIETQHGFWQTVFEAIRGTHHDYTSGPIGRAIILLAVPMVLEMFMESLFAVADVFWAGHIGPIAIATITLTESMLTVVYTGAMGLSIGVTAMVARRIGEKNPEGAAEAAVQGIALGVIVAAIIGVLGAVLAPDLLAVMGAAPDVIAMGHGYTRLMLGGNIVILLIFLINAIFRGAGDAAIALRVLTIANLINIVLCPLLMFGVGPFPRLGVFGAAVGTTIGRGTGVLYQLYRLWRRDGRVVIHRDQVRLKPAVMRTLLRLSGTGTFQVFVGMASWIGLTRINASFGTDALAGYQIAIRIIIFALLPAWGLANAAATMVGQALGAGKPERGEAAVWQAAFYNLIFLGAAGLCFVVFANPIAHAFTKDPIVASIAARCLRIISYGYLFYAYGMVLTNSFNGAGDTWTPTWLNLFCFWLWEIPLAWLLARHFNLGPQGVAWAVRLPFRRSPSQAPSCSARALEAQSCIIRAMRHLRIVVALLFGLAMVGRETHACPIDSAAPAASTHHQGSHQHSKSGCTCPQACCPAAAPVALPTTASAWNAAPRQVRVLDPDLLNSIVLPSRKHILPIALAPPAPPPVS